MLMKLKQFIEKHITLLVTILTSIISVGAIIYFMMNGFQNLANYDAMARLNIARKITDNIAPGVGQLGGIWLPFPHVLMVPFVQFEVLWKTGIAGALVLGPLFVLGAVYLQKTAYVLTKSLAASLIAWLMYVTNINLLLLQSMVLSEVFFTTCLIMITYFLTKWMQKPDIKNMLAASIFIILITLTRYEGYFVFAGSALVVLIGSILHFRKDGWQKIEGMMLLFLMTASFGIILWCIYSFLFYGDFLNWLHLYSAGKLQVATATEAVGESSQKVFEVEEFGLTQAFSIYTQSILWMNGKILTMLGAFGFLLTSALMIKHRHNQKYLRKYLPLVVISFVVFAFLVYGYLRGFIPEIILPPQNLSELTANAYYDSNIRYGIILAPCIVLLAALVAARNKIMLFIVLLLLVVQVGANIYKPQTLQLSLPLIWPPSIQKEVDPFLSLYDQRGMILISANAHENFMFQTGLPYKRFISEGSREYWMESLNDPGKYADWVIYNTSIDGDAVNYFLTEEARQILQHDFEVVYDVNGFKIWRLR
jgi:hypothetical protein